MSGYCEKCGSTNFTLVDGFFYCDVCNTQSLVLREFDHEDEGAVLSATLSTKIRQKKKRIATSGKGLEDDNEVKNDEGYRLPAIKKEDFPNYLGHAGLRLATFTKLLSHFTATLIRNFHVAECVKMHVLDILQRYLQHSRIAFCEEELDEEHPYCPLVKNENYETQKETKELKVRAEKESQLKCGKNVMSLLKGEDFSANLDVQLADSEMEDLHVVVQQQTKLSMAAISTVRDIPMNTEMIIAVLYLGCLFSGASWMLLSDITRWFREGRFPLTLFHRTALLVGSKKTDLSDAKKVTFFPSTPSMPLYEYMRTIMVLSQLTEIPVQPITSPFEQILARLSYNLNLPFDFLHRLHAIYATLTPNVHFDAQFTHQFGIFDFEALLEKTNDPFYDNINFAIERNDRYKNIHGRIRQYSVIPTIEVKAVAMILFTLKLIFGLNDDLEFNLKAQPNALGAKEELFDYSVWIHQLKMRMNAWRGRRLKDILTKRITALPSYNTINESYRNIVETKNAKGEKVTQIRSGPMVGGRNLYFRGCVPSYFVQEERDYALFNIFEDDFDLDQLESLEKEALLTPLRYQATCNREWFDGVFEGANVSEAESNKFDRYNAEVFFKSFKHHRMEYILPSMPINIEVEKSESSCSSNTMTLRWQQLFPCSGLYEVYPRPTYCAGLVKPTNFGNRLYIPMVYTSATDVVYQCAYPYFSDSFKDLLEILALTIGEDVKIVYTFFLMLEAFDKTIRNCDTFTISAQIELLGDKSYHTEVQMHRINENVPHADFKFMVADFGVCTVKEELARQDIIRKKRKIADANQIPKKPVRIRCKRKRQRNIYKRAPERSDTEEDSEISTSTCDLALASNFERMVLRSYEQQRSPCCEVDGETSFESVISNDINLESSDDNGLSSLETTSVQKSQKKRNSTKSSRKNIVTRSLLQSMTNRFTEYFSFSFETAFALTLSKYW